LALAHFGFNAISVLTIMPFVPLIEKLLNWALPEKD
jgi:Na+/phosphate symporter